MADELIESEFVFPEKVIDPDSYSGRYYSELLRGLTHKLNNLLAVIQGFSSLILMQEDLDEVTKENLQHMKEAGVSASLLGERVLPAAGCARVDIAEVALGETAALLVSRFRKVVEEAGLTFDEAVDRKLPRVAVDPSKLREILDSLVRNAIEASQPGGTVSLGVRGPEQGTVSEAAILVRNTGSPVPPDKLAEIFKPFFTTKDSSHWGMGLTTAHVLAGQMGLSLGVQSGPELTTFWLRLPVAAA